MASTTKTAKPSKRDYQAMAGAELDAMRTLLHSLDDEQWEVPSLCEGWKVRHVVGHMCLGATAFLKAKPLTSNLRFVATDIHHAIGEGAEVRGPAEPLVLAMSGRTAGLDELDGDGLPTLRSRL